MRQLGKYGHRILLVVWLTINAIGITTQVGKESVFTWADYTSTLAALLLTAWLAWWASWEAKQTRSEILSSRLDMISRRCSLLNQELDPISVKLGGLTQAEADEYVKKISEIEAKSYWLREELAGRADSPQSIQVQVTDAQFQEVLAHLTEISRITGRPASDFYDVNRENK